MTDERLQELETEVFKHWPCDPILGECLSYIQKLRSHIKDLENNYNYSRIHREEQQCRHSWVEGPLDYLDVGPGAISGYYRQCTKCNAKDFRSR